MASISFLPAA